MRRLWYNSKFGAHRTCARRQIKKSQYPNWLHSPTHFREHSVALLSRPNVHDLWRVRFRNFLSCGFYLGGLLISFTSFLCFNYSTSWLFCQHFFYFERGRGLSSPPRLGYLISSRSASAFANCSRSFATLCSIF